MNADPLFIILCAWTVANFTLAFFLPERAARVSGGLYLIYCIALAIGTFFN